MVSDAADLGESIRARLCATLTIICGPTRLFGA